MSFAEGLRHAPSVPSPEDLLGARAQQLALDLASIFDLYLFNLLLKFILRGPSMFGRHQAKTKTRVPASVPKFGSVRFGPSSAPNANLNRFGKSASSPNLVQAMSLFILFILSPGTYC